MQRAGGELLHGLLHSAAARDRGHVRRKGRSIALRDGDAQRDDELGMLVGLRFDPPCVPDELRAVVPFAVGGNRSWPTKFQRRLCLLWTIGI